MSDQVPQPDETLPQKAIQQITEDAEHQLLAIDSSAFSEQAFARLKEKFSEYAAQLIAESLRVSQRHRADTVSTADVEQASQYLVSSTSRKIYKHFGTIGGILLGAGSSNLLAMITTGQYNTAGIIVTFTLTVIGSFLAAVHIAKE